MSVLQQKFCWHIYSNVVCFSMCVYVCKWRCSATSAEEEKEDDDSTRDARVTLKKGQSGGLASKHAGRQATTLGQAIERRKNFAI